MTHTLTDLYLYALDEEERQREEPPPGPWNEPYLDEWHCDACATVAWTEQDEFDTWTCEACGRQMERAR